MIRLYTINGFMWKPAEKLLMTEEQAWVEAKTSRPTVVQWRTRFKQLGPAGLAEDAPHGRSSRARPADEERPLIVKPLL